MLRPASYTPAKTETYDEYQSAGKLRKYTADVHPESYASDYPSGAYDAPTKDAYDPDYVEAGQGYGDVEDGGYGDGHAYDPYRGPSSYGGDYDETSYGGDYDATSYGHDDHYVPYDDGGDANYGPGYDDEYDDPYVDGDADEYGPAAPYDDRYGAAETYDTNYEPGEKTYDPSGYDEGSSKPRGRTGLNADVSTKLIRRSRVMSGRPGNVLNVTREFPQDDGLLTFL